MDDVQENSEVTQVAPDQQTENHDEAVQQQTKAAEESRQERNWTAFRQRQKELERELKSQRELNEKLISLASQQAVKPEVDELDSIGDDEYISKGKVNHLVQKKASKIAEEIAQKKVDEALRQREQSQFLDNLKRKFSDFDDVVNPDTIALLEEQEPELAQTIADLKDPYKMGVQSYKFIKSLGLTDKVPESRRAKEIEKKLEQNKKTVQSPQVFDKRPMAAAFKMTDAEKNELYKEMMGFAAQAGSGY
jgi:glutaredoxin